MAKAMTRHDAQLLPLSFTLNGRLQELDVEPHELLLERRARSPGSYRREAFLRCASVRCLYLVGRRPAGERLHHARF